MSKSREELVASARAQAARRAPKRAGPKVGVHLHTLMRDVALMGRRLDHDQLDEVIDRFKKDHPWAIGVGLAASATAELTTSAHQLVRQLPPPSWSVLAAEDRLDPHTQPDVIWRADRPITITDGDRRRTGRVVIDEYKMGARTNTARWERTAAQVRRYLDAGVERWGDDLVGVRVLQAKATRGSVLYIPHAPEPIPLMDTPLWFHHRGTLQRTSLADHGRPEACVCTPCRQHRLNQPRYGRCPCGLAVPASGICDFCN